MPEVEALQETAEEAAQFEAMLNEQPAPEAQPEPQPEPKPEPAPEPAKAAEPAKEPEKPVRLVPHQALHEEREARKALQRELEELRKAQQPQPQPVGDQEPDETQDPIGSIAWLKAELKREREEKANAQAQQAYLHDLGQKVKTRVDAYAAEHPEYPEQVKFLREFRVRELVEGLGYSPEMAVQQVHHEEIALGKQAIDNDLDPAEMVVKLATVRGWKAKEADPAPAPASQPAKEAEEKIERLARGQKAATSSSGSGGGAPDDEMTVEKLLGLTGAAFDTAFAKHGKRLMGG